ncbi:hypothetical protein C9374_008236 [Naegleria lovaniensis]|uniref:Guanine nucleotide-binding protein subunit beta-like protein n=1 Tax=Naegleria lovaniensis TaxID=51637 RepID=A0AA88KFS8_NAELO|nr:uncharacterized protein C9374_008236 [Naegleria lovaniensis]KAG2378597.1 hypothetical protein C9374_008236 [Naegleria lovaniensis]
MPRKKAEASSSKKADKSATTEIKNDEESESTKMTRKSTRKKKSISYEDTAIDLSSTDDEKSKSKKKKASSKKRKKKEDDDEDSYVPESSENEDDVISVADSVEEVHSDASEEPKAKKSKKKKDSVSKTKSSKKEKTSKPKKTTKKKSSNIERTLTHHVTNESIVINCENLCPQFCPIIESREIKDDVVRSIIVQGSDNTSPNVEGMLSKTIFLNTKPEKERKNYVPEDRSMERPCIQVEIPFHQGTLIESRAENVKSDAQNFAILNIGAPVWAMDWVNKSPENSDQYAAIAPHTTHSAFHKCGKITSQHDLFRPLATSSSSAISDFDHCGKIQLWNFGKLTSKGQLKMKPSIDFYVEQNHGFIWDLKWMPNSYVADKRLGILGCACSDGTILIISIPLLSQINHDPLNRIPYCLAWSPNCKYLLGGYNDGTVSLWKINSNASLQDNKPLLELVSTIQAHNHPTNDLAIRSMSWFDPALNENIFATCSNDGMNKIWDLRDIYYPYYSAANANRFWSTGIVFPEGSNALLCISHDGNIRQFDAVENAFQLLSTTDGPLWDISLCSSRASFVVCTATGRVEVMSLEQDSMGRKRRSVDTRVDDLLLQIDLVVDDDTSSEKQSLDKIAKSMKHAQLCYSLPYHVPTCESDNVKSYSKLPTKVKDIKLVPDERISIHRCLFHPSKSQHLRNWCLVGGYDGLVFAIPVPEHYSE